MEYCSENSAGHNTTSSDKVTAFFAVDGDLYAHSTEELPPVVHYHHTASEFVAVALCPIALGVDVRNQEGEVREVTEVTDYPQNMNRQTSPFCITLVFLCRICVCLCFWYLPFPRLRTPQFSACRSDRYENRLVQVSRLECMRNDSSSTCQQKKRWLGDKLELYMKRHKVPP